MSGGLQGTFPRTKCPPTASATTMAITKYPTPDGTEHFELHRSSSAEHTTAVTNLAPQKPQIQGFTGSAPSRHWYPKIQCTPIGLHLGDQSCQVTLFHAGAPKEANLLRSTSRVCTTRQCPGYFCPSSRHMHARRRSL